MLLLGVVLYLSRLTLIIFEQPLRVAEQILIMVYNFGEASPRKTCSFFNFI